MNNIMRNGYRGEDQKTKEEREIKAGGEADAWRLALVLNDRVAISS
jgi:hypothetical protein